MIILMLELCPSVIATYILLCVHTWVLYNDMVTCTFIIIFIIIIMSNDNMYMKFVT